MNRFTILALFAGLMFTTAGLPGFARAAESRDLVVAAYTVAKEAYERSIIPAFQRHWKARTGEEVRVRTSYTASGAQARAIIGAKEALAIVMPDGDWQRAIQAAARPDPAAAPPAGATTADEDLVRTVLHSSRSVRLTRTELAAESRRRSGPAKDSAPPAGGALAAPLTDAEGRPFGVLQVYKSITCSLLHRCDPHSAKHPAREEAPPEPP